jgi:hypothetical protein
MKKSELRQIIQEEIKAVLEIDNEVNRTINDKFKEKMGFKSPEGGSNNKMGLPLEKLPGYSKLPEEGNSGDDRITLPNLTIADAGINIYSKEKAKEWEMKFMKKWGLAPGEDKIRFSTKIPFNIINASDKYNKWKAGEIMTKGAAYDKLGSYKGD